MTEVYSGWAIEARSDGPLDGPRRTLIGRYFIKGDISPHMEGHHKALFKTRAAARAALPKRWEVYGNKHWYVVVKAKVQIHA